MADEGSAALGAPEVAGCMVNPRGMAKKMTMSVAGGQVAGAVGSLVAAGAAGGAYAGAPDLPNFGRVGYVAASEAEVALIKTKSGAFKMHVTDQVLVRAPRSALEAVELDEGMLLSHLKLRFAGGTTWEFDVPKAGKKAAKSFVAALGGTVT